MNTILTSLESTRMRHHSRASLRLRTLVSVLLFLLWLPGCGKISAEIVTPKKKPGGLIDFARTEILDNGPVPADGSSKLTIAIHLKNSDHTPVVSYLPTYEIVSGLGVLPSNCSTSNADGVSICLLKATQPGAKKFRLTNAKQGLERDVLFDRQQRKGQVLGLATAGDQTGTTNGGYRVQATVGDEIGDVRKISTNRGYQVQLSIQGQLLSQ